MIRRRAFLASAATLWAQSRRPFSTPDVLVVWTTLVTLPDAVRKESLIFPRAYVAASTAELARKALEYGKYPSAIRAGDFAFPFRQLTARSSEDVIKMSLGTPPGVITVVTSMGAGDDQPAEASLHVPVAIRYPGMLITRAAPEILFSHVDLVPTVFGLAGFPIPEGVQGKNLAPLLMRHQGEIPDSVYIQGKQWRAVVRGYDKLVTSAGGEAQALFNLADDPQEHEDLAKNPAQRLTRDGMLALAQNWMRRLNDGFDSSGAKLR